MDAQTLRYMTQLAEAADPDPHRPHAAGGSTHKPLMLAPGLGQRQEPPKPAPPHPQHFDPSGGHKGQKMVFGNWRKLQMTPQEHETVAAHHAKKSKAHVQAAEKERDHARSFGGRDATAAQGVNARTHRKRSEAHFALADAHDHLAKTHQRVVLAAHRAGHPADKPVDRVAMSKMVGADPEFKASISPTHNPHHITLAHPDKTAERIPTNGVSIDGVVHAPENDHAALALEPHRRVGELMAAQ